MTVRAVVISQGVGTSTEGSLPFFSSAPCVSVFVQVSRERPLPWTSGH